MTCQNQRAPIFPQDRPTAARTNPWDRDVTDGGCDGRGWQRSLRSRCPAPERRYLGARMKKKPIPAAAPGGAGPAARPAAAEASSVPGLAGPARGAADGEGAAEPPPTPPRSGVRAAPRPAGLTAPRSKSL